MLRSLDKPPQMEMYNRTTDKDELVEKIECVMDYQGAKDPVKCKVFAPTLKKLRDIMWCKSLWANSINSPEDICRKFTSHFKASHRHTRPKKHWEPYFRPKTNPCARMLQQGGYHVKDVNNRMKVC
jgi:hypothetical protein